MNQPNIFLHLLCWLVPLVGCSMASASEGDRSGAATIDRFAAAWRANARCSPSL